MSIEISIPETRLWDPVKEEFLYVKSQKLLLEHSLLSISKWEAKWKKPYLNSDKTPIEVVDYIRCMTLTKNVDPNVYYAIPTAELEKLQNYIVDPMTATTITNHEQKRPGREVITAEILYWQMAQLNIDLEWEKRHLNRLITLIQVCAIKSQPPKKMSKRDIAKQNKALNAARRKQHHTRG